MLLLAGFASALISAVHDFVWIRALGEVDHSYWMPWTVPLTLPGFTIMLMNRVVKAFNDIEQLNATLEQRFRSAPGTGRSQRRQRAISWPPPATTCGSPFQPLA